MTKRELKDYSDRIFQALTDREIDTSQFTSYEEFAEFAKTLDNEFPFCYGMWDCDIPSWFNCTRLDLKSGKLFPFQTERLFNEEQYERFLDEIDDLLSDDDELSDLDDDDIGRHINFFEWQVHYSMDDFYHFYGIDFIFVVEDENGELVEDFDGIVVKQLIANGDVEASENNYHE